MADFGIKDYRYVALYYDAETDMVAIEPTNVEGKGHRKITYLGGTALISGGAFLKHFNAFDFEHERKYEPKLNVLDDGTQTIDFRLTP